VIFARDPKSVLSHLEQAPPAVAPR
jgi:hypothetical protein